VHEEYGSDESIAPDKETIVKDVVDSCAVKRIAATIEDATRIRNALLRAKKGPKPAATAKEPSNPAPVSKGPVTPAAAAGLLEEALSPVVTNTGTGTACNTPAAPRVAAVAPAVTPTAPTMMSMKELLVKITDDLRKMNLSDERDFDEALVKTCRHAGYKLLTLLADAQDGTPKGTVYLTRSTGGTPATYVKCQRPSQGGDSE
jgi:hypothetical protein